ncbi:CPBP family intramembrane glutamic endopeptidase [Staphylococcus massiliensis]|uniref:CPBP family intramembrane glutamic endopeptidase n=1 Tax=Staphylococcus massiliensis TaxID=555791 RepID=UPI001EDE0120|nr:type II CAAX endopeptidase family protein [Staphylococcus massiliensis]MCG3411589.1 CPBP family intramembrane metalloprotease [Staphylococcus massiliensis]
MTKKRISGFQWAMTIFVFFVITFGLPLILKDFQDLITTKKFVFSILSFAPFIASLICILVFKHKRIQLGDLKLGINLKVIERLLLAILLPLIIFIIGMVLSNTYADSFILLQAKDLSVPLWQLFLGQLATAFLLEFGFRSYLQHIVEQKVYTFIASIIVGVIYALWFTVTSFGLTFAMYNFLFYFAFSLIAGELIRDTKGRTIYIATVFHTLMAIGQIFFFSEETGELFSIKLLSLTTLAGALIYIIINMLIRLFKYGKNKAKQRRARGSYDESLNTDYQHKRTYDTDELDETDRYDYSNRRSEAHYQDRYDKREEPQHAYHERYDETHDRDPAQDDFQAQTHDSWQQDDISDRDERKLNQDLDEKFNERRPYSSKVTQDQHPEVDAQPETSKKSKLRRRRPFRNKR